MSVMIKTSVCHLLVMVSVIVGACDTKTSNPKKENLVCTYEGDYVTDGYARRAEGYDWSVVSITWLTDSAVNVSVRSRADIKKGSCSFDATAFFRTEDTLVAKYEDADIFFVISSDTLEISSDTPGLLYFFCSGGGTLAGEYIKLHERLDVSQLVDKTAFPEYR